MNKDPGFTMTQTAFSMKKNYIFFLFLLSCMIPGLQQKASAQYGFTVQPCADSAAVVALFDSVFLSRMPPQSIANITFYGDPVAVGYFKNANFLGFVKHKGIVLTTGKSEFTDNSNQCNTEQNASTNNSGVEGDPDLEQLAGVSSHDGCIIEFDFKPVGDTARFNYVFASEEYHEYVNASFNDMLGFFLSGPEISGPFSDSAINIALIPGTTIRVAINTINFGKGGITCTGKPTGCKNCEWFKDNSQSSDPVFSKFVYDALTTALSAKQAVEHGQWYHIKIALSDGGDAIYDSAVLLERGSFKTGSIKKGIGIHIMD